MYLRAQSEGQEDDEEVRRKGYIEILIIRSS